MICLTGDVHHSSLQTIDSRFCRGSEIEAALEAANIAQKFGVKYTLFCTGRCAKENPLLLKKIADMDGIEVGGHNYFAFKYKKCFSAYKRLTGLKNGPYFYQAWEVRKTVAEIGRISGTRVLSWRDHAYRHDRNTRGILKANGIHFFSDRLSAGGGQPFLTNGIIEVPINTIPDHDFVYHGARQPGTFDEKPLRNSVFQTEPMFPSEWLEAVKIQVGQIIGNGGLATVLAHPACMELFDGFATLGKLCQYLARFRSLKMSEIRV